MSATTCPANYSYLPNENVCARNCVSGLYIADGLSCWPICPTNTSLEGGSYCLKSKSTRTEVSWTDLGGRRRKESSGVNFLTGSSTAAGCPPNYLAYTSTQLYPNSTNKIINCFIDCEVEGETTMNSSGACEVKNCPTDDFTGARFPDFTGTSSAMTGQAIPSSTSKAKSCSKAAYYVNANKRNIQLPECPAGKSPQFYKKENGVTVYSYTTPSPLVANTDDYYSNYFECTNTCSGDTSERNGDYCMTSCPADTKLITSIDYAASSQNITNYATAIFPTDEVSQRRCIRTVTNVTTSDFTLYANDNSCSGTDISVPRWKNASTNMTLLKVVDASVSNGTYACVKTDVCSTKNPVGFESSGSDIKVFCSSLSKNCGNWNGSNFSTDSLYSNTCKRKAVFSNPQSETRSSCPSGTNLLGKQIIIEDVSLNTNGGSFKNAVSANLFNGVGYNGERNAYNIEATRVTYSGYDSSRAYKFGDIISFTKDSVESFTISNGRYIPWTYSDALTEPDFINEFKEYPVGPFFKCIQDTSTGAGYAPPTIPSSVYADYSVLDRPTNYINTYYKQSSDLQSGGGVFSNSYWTTADIPTRIIWVGAATATKSSFKSEWCASGNDSSGVEKTFCPLICANKCSDGDATIDYNNPKVFYDSKSNTYKNYFSVTNNTNNKMMISTPKSTTSGTPSKTVTSDLYCMPTCDTTKLYTAIGEVCISKSTTSTLAEPGYSWCPNAEGDPLSSVLEQLLPINTEGDGKAFNNKCYTPCQEGQIPLHEKPFTKCVTGCPKDGRFVDTVNSCIKIPAIRSTTNTDGSAIVASTSSQIGQVEESFSGITGAINLLGLGEPNSKVATAVAGVSIFSLLIIIVLLIMKKRLATLRQA